jgi:hypothetical protein
LSVVSVMIELAPLVPGVTLTGENAQEELAGSPEQERAMELAKVPPRGVRLTVKLYGVPRRSPTLFGLTLI